MTDNTDTLDNAGTTADTEDDEFDDLFNFTSPSTPTTEATNIVPPTASSPIHFGLGSDSDSSDSELDDSVPPPNSKNNTSLESSSYYEVSSSTGTSTPSTDGPKEGGDPFITGNVSGELEDTKHSPLMSLERQGEDAFLEMDEGTREMLDWLDKPGSSAADTAISAKSDSEGNTNNDDLDFVDIHMPDNLKEEKAEDDSDRAKETLIILGEEEEQTSANLPTVTIIPEKEERTQNLTPKQLTPTAPVASKIAPVSYQSNAILTESYCADDDDFDDSSNNDIKGDIAGKDDDLSEGGSDISDLFLTEENEYDEEEEEEEEEEDLAFANISEAVRSTQSNVQKHILPFLQTESNVSVDDRPWLWTKAICGKILTDVKSSSLADSFVSWDKSFHLIDLEQNANLSKFGVDANFVEKHLKEVDCLADRIVTAKCEDTEEAKNRAKRDLSSLLLFYYHSGTTISESANEENESSEYGDMEEVIDNTTEDKDPTSKQKQNKEASKTSIKAVEWNSLIGPIAATLLSSSVCVSVASVMLSTIIPVAMPLVSLTTTERLDAAKKIHSTFYLLVCYHLPMLVLHLDRYCPGWHWPKEEQEEEEDTTDESPTRKGRNLESQGIIPTTWFTSQLAGECTADGTKTTTEIKPDQLLRLWDILLISNDNSLPFFLALRMLEKHSYKLLMLRGEDLTTELTTVMCFQETTTAVESFMGYDEAGSEDISPLDGTNGVDVWWNTAISMRASTPLSVVCDLRKAEDNAVSLAFQLRHKEAMDKMRVRLEKEAENHMAAVEEKRSMKEEEVQYAFYKTRLEKFYKKHCPDRIDRVESVLKVYEGRLPILNERLTNKYGSGFIPIFSPKLSMKTGNFMSTMGHGIRGKRKEFLATRVERKTMEMFGDIGIEQALPKHQVAMSVDAREILPFISKGKTAQSNIAAHDSLKYYLVDSRPEEMATLQGRFPTSVRLSPDDLMDPDCMQEKIDMFESLRGAVHICIMGEGFSSFSSLYDHPLSKNEERLLDDDETRTNMCALFFIKRGFPFVSILGGGFAAAHAWLSRECTHTSIASVLVDYDEELSLFAQLEHSYRDQIKFANASTREKTTQTIQELIDRSMTRLTVSENKLEQFTDTLRTEAGRKEVKESVSKILKRSATQIKKGVEHVKRRNGSEDLEEDTANVKPRSSETLDKDAVSSEGMSFKMRLAEFRERNKDRGAKTEMEEETNVESLSSETSEKDAGISFKMPFAGLRERNKGKGETRSDSPNSEQGEKEARSFKKFTPFGGLVKANPDKVTSEENLAKKFLREIGKKDDKKSPDSEGQGSTMNLKKNFGFQRASSEGEAPTTNLKKNFGFRSPLDSEATGKKKVFDFKMPKFSTKDGLEKEPSISKFKRNPFAKKVANSEKDVEKAISAALEGEDKQSAPLREKFVGFTKSVSQSIKTADKNSIQAKRPMISFNKLGSITKSQASKRTVKSEEESISFDDFDEKNIPASIPSLKGNLSTVYPANDLCTE